MFELQSDVYIHDGCQVNGCLVSIYPSSSRMKNRVSEKKWVFTISLLIV